MLMKRSFLLLILAVLLLQSIALQAAVDHYFLKIYRNGKVLELRKENTEGRTVKKVKFNWKDDPATIAQKLAPTGIFDQRIWVYFHCMWGNNSVFQRMTLGYIDELIDQGGNNTLLSVIWPANELGYKRNWKKVIEKGHRLGNFFRCMAQGQKGPVNVISHSMGNRIFQGVWQAAGDTLKLENLVLAAPDLDADIFGHDFRNMENRVKKIIVVQHHSDRLLLASSLIWKKERLGRTHHISPVPANLVLIDATAYSSSRAVDLSNHMHFIFADSVRTRIHEAIR